MTAEKDLFVKWTLFTESNNKDSLLEFTKEFLSIYSHFYDPDFQNLGKGLYNESPHLMQYPESLLDRLSQYIRECSTDVVINSNVEDLEAMAAALKCLVIICRNYDNVSTVASCDVVSHLVKCSQSVISQLSSQGTYQVDSPHATKNISFVKNVLYFLECLYDPYFVWRKRLKGWTVDVEQVLSKPAVVHNEIIPFFHECFQKSSLSEKLQICLLHMFGAVMSGSLNNATLTVTPATLDLLLNILSGKIACCGSVQSDYRKEIQQVILECIVGMVHTLHSCSPDQRQVEVPDILSSYMQVLLGLDTGDHDYDTLISVIDAISKMVECNDKLAMQTLLGSDAVMEGLVTIIKRSTLHGSKIQNLAKMVVKAMQTFLSGSKHCKERFEKCVGYSEFLALLQGCGQPTKDLLQSMLNLVVETKYGRLKTTVIKNAPAAVTLMKWVGSIESHDLQIWLSEEMNTLCAFSYGNRRACCTGGMVSVLLILLSEHSKLQLRTVGQIISLLERLGSLSITAAELKQLIGLMKPDINGKQFPYTTRLMRTISTMARRDGTCGPLHFFDIQQTADVISLPGIRKWPGPAFSFFTLLCLDTVICSDINSSLTSYRRLLYSFSTSNGCGFEAFIAPNFSLTVASFNKKEFSTVNIPDPGFNDGHWHSLCVVHMAGRRFPSSPGHVHVYLDGKLKSNVILKFPSLAEPITSCKVGSPGTRIHSTVTNDNSTDGQAEVKKMSSFKSLFNFTSRGSEANSCGPGVHTLESVAHEDVWGPAICLYGQLELICVFFDVLQAEQAKALHQIGSSSLFHFSEDPLLADLAAKLIARYSAKACKDHICTDISLFQNHGTFAGSCCVNWDVKDVINCLGGIQVLFPILEILEQFQHEILVAESPSSPSKLEAEQLDLDNWTTVNSKVLSSSELKLEYNPLAAFITMLRFILKKSANRDTFVRHHSAVTLGMLLQKVKRDLVDINVLMSIQYLIEDCNDRDPNQATKSTILQHIYHYILFDFSLWIKTLFAVRIGHIQYLSTIIKDDRKYFRKKYGIQFFLDIIRTHYLTAEVSCLNEEDSKTIRVSLFNLIKYYIASNIFADELNQIMDFILTIKEANVLLEAMDLIISLLESRNKKQDQLMSLLFEPDQAEMFYMLLTYQNQPIIFYEKVVKILYLLLKSERVYEKNKSRLRLTEIGHWGLISSMSAYEVSIPMIKRFLEQVTFTETPQTYSSLLAVLGVVHNCGLDIKSAATRQLLSVIVSKIGAAKGIAKQVGWQEYITRLLTMERKKTFTSSIEITTTNFSSQEKQHDTADNSLCTKSLVKQESNYLSLMAALERNTGLSFVMNEIKTLLPLAKHDTSISLAETDLNSSLLMAKQGLNSVPLLAELDLDISVPSDDRGINTTLSLTEQGLDSSLPLTELGLNTSAEHLLNTSHPFAATNSSSSLLSFENILHTPISSSQPQNDNQQPTLYTSLPSATTHEQKLHMLNQPVISLTDNVTTYENISLNNHAALLQSSLKVTGTADNILSNICTDTLSFSSEDSNIPKAHSIIIPKPVSFRCNPEITVISHIHGDTHPRPSELNLHSISTNTAQIITSESEAVDLLLAADPTPVTPLYIKRTFYQLGTSEDEETGFLQGCRSSTASIEDLLQDSNSLAESHNGAVSGSISSISLNSASFDLESPLGNPHSSNETLGNSSRSNSFGDFQRCDEIRRQSADIASEVEDNRRRSSQFLKGESFKQVLDHIGVELNEAIEQKEELCQHVLILLLTIMWKGVEGSGIEAWKERCQIFTWIEELGESHILARPPQEIKRRLMEMLLRNCTTDIRNSGGQISASQSENAIELIRLVQGFLTEPDAPVERFSIRLLEDVMSLLDILGVWDMEAVVAWTEMVHRGFSVLLAFSRLPDLQLVSSATVKLHSLVQTKLINSSAEASYILGALNSMIGQAIDKNTDNYVFLMPVLRALIDKGQELLTISTQLPHLPKTSMSSTFFDDFKTYVYSEEWQTFINNYVRPQMTHFIESNFEEGSITLSKFWADCHEQMIMTHHGHNREILDSKLKFKKQIESVYCKRVERENRRFQTACTMQRNQLLYALRDWRATRRFFTGERGAWNNKEETIYWKLSNQENFARMKVKLIQNYNFDNQMNASRLRDNIGVTDTDNSLNLEELKGVKEALVSKENIADDTLGDEEWSAISASNSNLEEYTGKEKLVISADCELITVVTEIKGRLEVTTTHIYFFDCSPHKEEAGEDFKWALSRVREIHFRRYNLRRSALEVFLIDQTNHFINFPEKGMRNKIYGCILSLRPENLIYKGQRSPADLLRASGLTQRWVNREISNFEYLMQLNTIAGRTYNDLSQYHVFPWVLMDYTSKQLDLEDPNVFRDLSKPVGVVNPRNEKEVREKYETFEDPSGVIEKFHYGTHYSNAASVMHYMVRVEPFTTLHIQLQSGKFDVADRQFHSIPGSFASLMDNPNDVKELIPEFFYFPEFLVNFNGFDLGKLQITKEPVNDVKLPPWASTPEEFIYKHRQALESEHVSMNLHKWIDLIFGYKQKGQAAVDALNVFYYVTYEGAVDLDAIQDPKERVSVEGMIRNFGQTPSQLLKEPHPKRLTFEEAVAKNAKAGKPMNVFYFVQDLKPFYVEVSNDRDPLVFVNIPKSQARSILQQGMPDSLVTITQDGIIGVHGWLPYDKAVPNFYTFDKDSTVTNPKARKRLGSPFSPGLKVTAKLFVVSHDAKLMFSGGYWDNSLQVYNLVRAKMINHIIRHIDIVTCMSIDNSGRHLVTGSRDTTCIIWEITFQGGVSVNLNPKPLQTLCGHDSAVTAVHISTELDLVVSASKDGTVIIHTVLEGHYTMTLRAPSMQDWTLDIPNMAVSDTGQIVLYCVEMEKQTGEGRKRQQKRHCLHLYSINGKHLFSEPLAHSLHDMCVAGDYLVLGSSAGQLIVKEIFGLRPIATMELVVPVMCLGLSPISSHILVGLKDGKLIIVGRKGKDAK